MPIDFSKYDFSPVIELPKEYEIFDFSESYDPNRELQFEFGIGRYNEKRPTMYTHEQYDSVRCIHMGVDIAAPVGTPVRAFFSGQVFCSHYHDSDGDYGATIILRHNFSGETLYSLYGHLSRKSLQSVQVDQEVCQGEIFAWVGDRHENGGWNPHLHFQLSYRKPSNCDLPGVVSESDHGQALADFPDPLQVLGPLYS